MNKNYHDKYTKLLKTVFRYMDKKGPKYCNSYTFEQIASETIEYEDVRFIEFCYGYSAEFRLANSLVAKKNITNELFHSKNIYIFKKGYSELIEAIYSSIKIKVDLKLHCNMNYFTPLNI